MPSKSELPLSYKLLGAAEHSVTISLVGATVISWVADGVEQLYLSPLAKTRAIATAPPCRQDAIRGGIPIVFPAFGKKAPFPGQHGFARNVTWHLCRTQQIPANEAPGNSQEMPSFIGGGLSVELTLEDGQLPPDVAAIFPFSFTATLCVSLFPNALKTTLAVKNTSGQLLAFDALFHTYFRTDIGQFHLTEGLKGASYEEKAPVCIFLKAHSSFYLERRHAGRLPRDPARSGSRICQCKRRREFSRW
jgi:glucose-6-phosphate 1-epimerase